MVAVFRHLIPYLATSPLQGSELDEELAAALRKYRHAADLARAIDSGSFSDQLAARLAEHLATAAEASSLVDPRDLLGSDRCVEQSQLSDLIHCTVESEESESAYILRELPPAEFVARSAQDTTGLAGQVGRTMTRSYMTFLERLLEASAVRTMVLNSRLTLPQTQFCLRHFLETRSDSIQLLSPRTFGDATITSAMRLEKRSWNGSGDSRAADLFFAHGPRRVDLVAFELKGHCTEVVAFDPAVDGYAQVRAVWPGQVADFFSRHAGLRARELFTEMTGTKVFYPDPDIPQFSCFSE